MFTLRKIKDEDLELIMRWRMSENVTRYMNTNPKLTLEGQRKWLASLDKNAHVRYYLIEVDGIPAGVINLADIDWEKGNCSWGYYIGEGNMRSLKLAVSLEMSLYDYCFDILGLKEVHNETFHVNEGVWKLHMACGCKIVNKAIGEVEKDGIRYDVLHLSISNEEWKRIRLSKKYERINFDIFYNNFVMGGVVLDHIGIMVSDLSKSQEHFARLGWICEGEMINDEVRRVTIAFMRQRSGGECIELIEPIDDTSPVYAKLQEQKGVATPYHFCYQTFDIDKTVRILKKRKYILIAPPIPAPAFDGRRVAFMLSRETGLIELLEANA